MENMNFDKWAKYYDIIYSGFSDDINFYIGEIEDKDAKILEIGCGTGRVFLPILKKGFDIWGLDISNKMIKTLELKARDIGLKPNLIHADMKNFRLKENLDMILIPFRSFIHNITTEDQIKTLKCVKKHLKSKGKFIINLFQPNPYYIVKNYNKKISQQIEYGDKSYKLIIESYFIDETDQTVNIKQTLKLEDKIIFREEFEIALIYKREFELLLELSGFRKWKVYGGFNYQPLKHIDQEMIWIIRK